MTLIINNEYGFKIDEDIIKDMEKCGFNTLIYDGFDTDCEISLSFVSDSEIREINSKFRNIDRSTDVLSFPQIDYEKEELALVNEKDEIILGDIIISYDTAIRQAEEYGHTLRRELCFLMVHSMLHLLGYDHLDIESEKEMFNMQEEILKKSQINR